MKRQIHPIVHLSYEDKPISAYGGTTTALVINNDIFIIVLGNHIDDLNSREDMFDKIQYLVNVGLHKLSQTVHTLVRDDKGFSFIYGAFVTDDGGNARIEDRKCTYNYSTRKFEFLLID